MKLARLMIRIARVLAVAAGVALMLLHFGCAKKGFPGGGPLDKTPPKVVSTAPASGEVEVTSTAEIQIDFSEPIERTTFLPNLFISPPLRGEPAVKWSKRSVCLRWDDTLRSAVTYRVTLGAKIADRRKNSLEDAFTFAFSTGTHIDSAHIAGQIWTGQDEAKGLEVFAYQIDSTGAWLPFADTVGGSIPEFISQTGVEGDFDLPYLPAARFRVLAIGDKNRNHAIDPGEVVGIPVGDVDLSDDAEPPPLRIFTQVYDTTSFAIKSCSFTEDGSILVGLTHPVDTAAWNGAAFTVIDSAQGETLSVEILRPVPPRLTVVPITSNQLVPGRAYSVRTTAAGESAHIIRDTRGVRITESECTLIFPAVNDTIGPRVAWTIFPDARSALTPRSLVRIGFDEPVDTVGANQLLRLYDSLGTLIEGIIRWTDRRQMSFEPVSSWPETTEVVVSLDSALLRDRHGNPPATQVWTWTFVPLTESMMGALACRVEWGQFLSVAGPCRVEARPQGRDVLVTTDAVPGEPFELPLPAGPWVLSAYIDRNNDGRFSPGSLTPYRPAEPRVVLADTVSVRARFTREDVVIQF